MAEGPVQINMSIATDESIQQLRAFDHGLLTTLIRAIIREELEACKRTNEEQPPLARGFVYMHEYDPSRELIRLPEGSSVFPVREVQ